MEGIRLGIIGYPLSHSFSPTYFAQKFAKENVKGASYQAFPLKEIDDVKVLLRGALDGFNVTIPYKQSIMPYLDQIDEEAAQAGAVNTVKITDGYSVGYNTDIIGFDKSLTKMLGDYKPLKALVLGTGGAARAVCYVLSKMDIAYTSISRLPPHVTYRDIDHKTMQEHRLIINTTPLGMSPDINSYPCLPYPAITDQHYFFDLIYNPEKTLFLSKAENYGARIKNGYEMLILQAESAWEIWTT